MIPNNISKNLILKDNPLQKLYEDGFILVQST